MSTKTPEQFFEDLTEYKHQLDIAKRMHVAVGLPIEKVGSAIYEESGMTVIKLGAIHEYGISDTGGAKMPRRSFLRQPFDIKRDQMSKILVKAFKLVAEGKYSAKDALELVGAKAMDISQEAFETKGYGLWPALSPETIEAKLEKGSNPAQILIDTGTLKNSITFEVRGR